MTRIKQNMIALAAAAIVATPAMAQALLVPAYFYPTDDAVAWQRLQDTARRQPLSVIVNPDSGAGLLLGDDLGLLLEFQAAHAEADGARGHDDDLGALRAERGDLCGERGQARFVELADAGGDDTGAELHDDATRRTGEMGRWHGYSGAG